MLQHKLTSRTARIGVVGLGYVGLPLALLCNRRGYAVTGIEKNEEKVEQLRRGESYVVNIADSDVRTFMKKPGNTVTSNLGACRECDVVLVCTPTPLTDRGQPDYSHLFGVLEGMSERMRRHQLIVIESTVGPGTTELEILPRLEEGRSPVGEGFFLAYSPERVDAGDAQLSLEHVPKLVSGVTDECCRLARIFYGGLGISTVDTSAPIIAEMAKLLENTYRDVNIALINETARICGANGIDIWEVISAASTKGHGFQPFYPGAGVGGHCIPVDSVYYSTWARSTGHAASLADLSRQINASMPEYAADRIEQVLHRKGIDPRRARILFLGVTYKKDVNDARQSPAASVIRILRRRGTRVDFHDPFVHRLTLLGQTVERVPVDGIARSDYDCVVLAVAHSCYELGQIVRLGTLMVDFTGSFARRSGNDNAFDLFDASSTWGDRRRSVDQACARSESVDCNES